MRLPQSATIIIAAITAFAWFVTSLFGADQWAAMTIGFIPVRFSGVPTLYPAVPAWLTPITSAFAHGGLLHLALNMLMLVWCGTKVERIIGSGPLVLLYVVGAYTAAVAQWLVFPQSPVPMIGASGAISAIIGAFALSFGQQKQIVSSPALNRTLNATWLLAAWVVLQLMTQFLAGAQGYFLATPAHVGGFIAGLLLQRPLLLWRYRNA